MKDQFLQYAAERDLHVVESVAEVGSGPVGLDYAMYHPTIIQANGRDVTQSGGRLSVPVT